MCTFSVSNVIYHKFTHGAAFYMLNWRNVNVMLEFAINHVVNVKVFNFCALMTSYVNMCLCRRPLQNNPYKKCRNILAFSFYIMLESK